MSETDFSFEGFSLLLTSVENCSFLSPGFCENQVGCGQMLLINFCRNLPSWLSFLSQAFPFSWPHRPKSPIPTKYIQNMH